MAALPGSGHVGEFMNLHCYFACKSMLERIVVKDDTLYVGDGEKRHRGFGGVFD